MPIKAFCCLFLDTGLYFDSGKDFIIRTPLIPTVTDTVENIEAIAKLLSTNKIKYIELMRYNKLAGAKYSMLGMEYPLDDRDNGDVDVNIFKNGKIC